MSTQRRPAAPKRLMRAVWRRLPRTALSYKLAKGLTRSVLRPEGTPLVTDILLGGRVPMQIDLSDIVGNDLFCMDDHYEAPTLALWTTLAREAAVIVDLGSHIGLYACTAAATNPHARVVAVEGLAENVAVLRRNASAFRNLTALHAVVGPAAGRGTFRMSPIAGGGYLEEAAAALEHDTTAGRHRRADRFAVDVSTLADLCAREGIAAIDLLKIDLEGLEHALLTGQGEFWTRCTPRHVLVEISAARDDRAAHDEIFAAMRRRGYRHRRTERLHTIPWAQPDSLANWHFWRAV